MSFTLAHPVLVLPLYKKNKSKFCLSALILGSMAPDFMTIFNIQGLYEVYKCIDLDNYWSIKTFILFYLPICIIAYLILKCLIKDFTIYILPYSISGRVMTLIKYNNNLNFLNKSIIFIYSTYIGVLSHAVLDEITHPNTFMWNFIKNNIGYPRYNIPLVLYLLTSIIGLIILVSIFNRVPIDTSFKKEYYLPKRSKILFSSFILFNGVFLCVLKYMLILSLFKTFIYTKNLTLLIATTRIIIIALIEGFSIGI
ncbi:DUF4184 family protein, partial [Clostridium botulinum D/C]